MLAGWKCADGKIPCKTKNHDDEAGQPNINPTFKKYGKFNRLSIQKMM